MNNLENQLEVEFSEEEYEKLQEEYKKLQEKIENLTKQFEDDVEFNPDDYMHPELEADKQRLEELRKVYENHPITIYEKNIKEYNDLVEKITTLTKQFEEDAEFNPDDYMYPEFEEDKKKLEDLQEKLRQHPIRNALALKNEYKKLQEEIDRLTKQIKDVEFNPEYYMYPEFEADKQRLENLIEQEKNNAYAKYKQLEEEHQKTLEEVSQLQNKIEDVEFNPEYYMYPEFEQDKQKLEDTRKKLSHLEKQLFDDKYKNFLDDSLDTRLTKSDDVLVNDLSEIPTNVVEEEPQINTPEEKLSNDTPTDATEEETPTDNPEEEEPTNDKWLESVKKISPWLSGAAGVTLGALGSIAIHANPITQGLSYARLAYSVAKLGNKVYSKHFLNGEPTPIDKWVNHKIDFVKENYPNIYDKVSKINQLLKKKETQWFLNGVSIGYIAGNALNLREKVNSLHQSKTSVTNTTHSPSDASTVTENSAKAMNHTGVEAKAVNRNVEATVNNTTNYDWLNTGDNIDLSKVEHGFTDSLKAMQETNSTNLLTKYATAENGTYIKWLKLPDGTNFTGNVGELLQSGIDPNTVAARIMNQNGDYAWMNLQDILEATSETIGKAR